MKFFVDTAEIQEIRELAEAGLVDGVTTNPSLVHKSGRNFIDVIKEICEVVDGPVSAEVAATDYETMLAEGRKLAKIADNVAVKVPLTPTVPDPERGGRRSPQVSGSADPGED
jgi:transaldolase